MTQKELEIAYLKAKYETEGLNTSLIDWDMAKDYKETALYKAIVWLLSEEGKRELAKSIKEYNEKEATLQPH